MESGNIFVAIEYLRYGDLSRHAAIGIPEIDVKEIAKDVLKGLEVMHQEDFTHRDIKPQNILVFQKKPEHPRWWVKIADFGISKQTPELSDTALHTVIGTRPYCAPEILGYLTKYADTSVYSSKVDIWSLGCVLFNIVSHGELPFSESDLVRYCDQTVDFNPRNHRLHLGDDGALFIKNLLQSEPERRPTASEALGHSWLTTVSKFAPAHDLNKTSTPPSNSRNFNSFLDSPVSTASLTQHASADFAGPLSAAASLSMAQHSSLKVTERSLPQSPTVSSDLHGAVSAEQAQENVTSAAPELSSLRNRLRRQDGGSVSSAISQAADESFSRWQSRNADQLNSVTFIGYSFHLAAYLGDSHILRYLAMKGAYANGRTTEGITPLHFAAEMGHLDVVKWLVLHQNANINAKGKSDWTPLTWTAYHGHLEMAKWFVEQGADVNVKVADGLTPLHWAAHRGHLAVARHLVERHANIDARTHAEFTPLHLAAEQGHLEAVKHLLEYYAYKIARTNDGSTPLHCAAQNGQLEVVKLLVKGNTSSLNTKTDFGVTPLHSAAIYGHLKVIKWLVEQHADINVEIGSGCIPLHTAAKHGHTEVVKYLVEQGCDVNAKAEYGWTALHFAVNSGNLNTVKWLMQEGGASPLQKLVSGVTPCALAEQEMHTEMATWLKGQEELREAAPQLKQLEVIQTDSTRTLRPIIKAERADSARKVSGWRRMFS